MAGPRSLVVCDSEAFYPFRALLSGHLSSPDELPAVERFLRSVVLHDEVGMDLEPDSYHPEMDEIEWTDEELEAGGRMVIVAIGPDVTPLGIFSEDFRDRVNSLATIPETLLKTVEEFSNAQEGNVYYDAHVNYLRRLFGVIAQGGSVVCDGGLGRAALEQASAFPSELFGQLDKDWPQYAEILRSGNLGLNIPPVLAIVLSRCARRDAILTVVKDLRDEWATAREKVWQLVGALRDAPSLRRIDEIRRELKEASKYFSPATPTKCYSPMRVLWDITTAAAGGAAITSIAGGDPRIGAISKALSEIARLFSPSSDELRRVFSRGAFDLARRVSRETASVAPLPDLLSRFLAADEKKALGLD
jgi:hypothetical protein